MKIGFNWIKNYVNIGLSVDSLADKLTMAGLEVEEISTIDGETVIEMEITPNRPDCLNLLGIAREISAILDIDLVCPEIMETPKISDACDIKIEDTRGCLRYKGTLIENVNIKPTSKDIVSKIIPLGIRSINNVVDVTNFCLLEMGQPLHAFDYDKLAGGKIVVRRAKKGEKIITIDDVERELDPTILVIADEEKPVAIAGIMGGKATEVTSETKNILLESAFFDSILIRKASRKLGLSSDSSYRFERGVDYATVELCSNRAIELILKEAGGSILKHLDVEVSSIKEKGTGIIICKEEIDNFLGIEISVADCKKIFEKLGFDISLDNNCFTLFPPAFRRDIKEKVDIIEEIARIIGYDNLPSEMPRISISSVSESRDLKTRKTIHRVLVSSGFSETVTYTMISQKNLDDSGLGAIDKLKIMNPLSLDQEMMRPSLLPSMLSRVQFNLNRGQKNLSLFELGKIYTKQGEQETLAIIMSGIVCRDWRLPKQKNADYYDIKGMIEKVFIAADVSMNDISFEAAKETFIEDGACSEIFFKNKKIGILGLVAESVLDSWDIKGAEVLYAQIDLEVIYKMEKHEKKYDSIVEFPVVTRDISLAIKKETTYNDIVKVVQEDNNTILYKFDFVEEYFGDKLPGEQYKGIVCSCKYQSKSGTLKEEEVTQVHERICSSLIEATGAIRR